MDKPEIIKVNVFWGGTLRSENDKLPMHTLTIVGEETYKALESMMIDMPYILEKVIDEASKKLDIPST